MMDSDKQFDIVIDRAETLRVRRRYINKVKASCISLCVSVACVLCIIFFMPGDVSESHAEIGRNAGSMMIKGGLKAIITCVLSFATGVFFTLLCVNIRNLKKRSGKDDER